MVAILLTGMSGAGKSTALAELGRRGHETVDTDDGGWIEVVDGEPLWVPMRIEALLAGPRSAALFVVGTVANQGRWLDRFDAVVLMTAPLEVLLQRVRTRTGNPFGRVPDERAKIARDTARVEPRLRASATHVLDTMRPLGEVVDALERIAASVRDRSSDDRPEACPPVGRGSHAAHREQEEGGADGTTEEQR